MKIKIKGVKRKIQIVPAVQSVFVVHDNVADIIHPQYVCIYLDDDKNICCAPLLLEDEDPSGGGFLNGSISSYMPLWCFKGIVENRKSLTGDTEAKCANDLYTKMMQLKIEYDKRISDYVYNLSKDYVWRGKENH